MSPRPASNSSNTVYFLGDKHGNYWQLLLAVRQEAGYELESLTYAEVSESIHFGKRKRPFSVVIQNDWPVPLAQRILQVWPGIHILLVTDNLPELRKSLASTPMAGSNWDIVDKTGRQGHNLILNRLEQARQRQAHRIALQNINSQLFCKEDTEQSEFRRLAISDRYLATILNQAQDAIFSIDDQGTITTWNQAAVRLWGYSEQEVLGRGIRVVFSQDLPIESNDAGMDWQELECLRNDGTSFIAEASLSRLWDHNGRTLGFVVIARDITERMTAARLIQEEKQWLKETLASLGDAVIATDENDHIRFLNPKACQILNVELKDALSQALGQVWRTTRENELTYLLRHDGRKLPIELTKTPIVSGSGKLLGSVMVFRNISARLNAEREREDLLARERAARIEVQRLYRLSERMNRMKDEFLATLSHELRTPLSAIIGFADLLRNIGWETTEELNEGLDAIHRNALVQERLVADLLDVASIITGKLKLDVEQLELGNLVEDALKTIEFAASSKFIEISMTGSANQVPIMGDRTRLQQVVWNLLSNAVKFTPKHGRIEVQVNRLETFAEIKVYDNGSGIVPEFLPYVFDRFRQHDSTVTRAHGGLGLGLAIVRNIVELHGGTVKAESDGIDQGSCFTITLPLAKQD